jgi:hypothetical protein
MTKNRSRAKSGEWGHVQLHIEPDMAASSVIGRWRKKSGRHNVIFYPQEQPDNFKYQVNKCKI